MDCGVVNISGIKKPGDAKGGPGCWKNHRPCLAEFIKRPQAGANWRFVDSSKAASMNTILWWGLLHA
jgi:hypothetical protein